MRVFVIHYPPLAQRKRHLLAQFQEFGIDAEWVENFNQDDPFVIWLKKITNTKLPISHLSAFVKRLFVYKKMVDENINEAIIFEDDVVLHPKFKEFSDPVCFNYLRLGVGINEGEIEYSSSTCHKISNPGGGEAVWVTREFARGFLDDLNFEYSHDIVEFAHLKSTIWLLPICWQTSLRESGASSSCETYDSQKWVVYSSVYKYLPKWKFEDLLKMYSDELG